MINNSCQGVIRMVFTKEFKARLDGDQEVPPVKTDATGTARIFFINTKPDLLLVLLCVRNIKDVFAAHIHLGAPGVNGPIVLTLFGPTDPVDVKREALLVNRAFTKEDLEGPLAGQPLETLVQNMAAGNTYVNVHTVEHFPPYRDGVRPALQAKRSILPNLRRFQSPEPAAPGDRPAAGAGHEKHETPV